LFFFFFFFWPAFAGPGALIQIRAENSGQRRKGRLELARGPLLAKKVNPPFNPLPTGDHGTVDGGNGRLHSKMNHQAGANRPCKLWMGDTLAEKHRQRIKVRIGLMARGVAPQRANHASPKKARALCPSKPGRPRGPPPRSVFAGDPRLVGRRRGAARDAAFRLGLAFLPLSVPAGAPWNRTAPRERADVCQRGYRRSLSLRGP